MSTRVFIALGLACTGALTVVACTFPSIGFGNGTGGSQGASTSSSHATSTSGSGSTGPSTSSSSGSTSSTSSSGPGGSTTSSSSSSSSSANASSTSSGTTACGTCDGGFACENATMCKTSCTSDNDCNHLSYCDLSKCLPRVPNGGACTGDNQCESSVCGVNGTGKCCAQACEPTDGGVCGPTGCDSTGLCEFPGASTTCGMLNCTGFTLTPAPTCGGNGACEAMPAPCPNNFTCASTMACRTSCTASTQCQSGYICIANACTL